MTDTQHERLLRIFTELSNDMYHHGEQNGAIDRHAVIDDCIEWLAQRSTYIARPDGDWILLRDGKIVCWFDLREDAVYSAMLSLYRGLK